MLQRVSGAQTVWRGVADAARHSRYYLAALLALLLLTYFFLHFGSSSPTRDARQWALITIPAGAGDEEVARILKSNNLIRSRAVYGIARHIGYEGRPYVAGSYRLRKDMSAFQVLDILIRGKVASARVTIPEGFTIAQIARRLEAKEVTDAAAFAEAASGRAADIGVATPTGSLEGYLFPDTYQFAIRAAPKDVLKKMHSTMTLVLSEMGGDLKASGRSVHEILTVASMVEREARTSRDRPLVASVIYNRLERGMPLQVDATVIYALGQHTERVLYRHLETPSLYNTYRRKGLPPGPIANPGRSAIEAAVRPARSSYLYYVAKPDGSHLFAQTFDEHKANIRRARGR